MAGRACPQDTRGIALVLVAVWQKLRQLRLQRRTRWILPVVVWGATIVLHIWALRRRRRRSGILRGWSWHLVVKLCGVHWDIVPWSWGGIRGCGDAGGELLRVQRLVDLDSGPPLDNAGQLMAREQTE